MPFCAFDTETSGLWIDDLPIHAPEQPRICQLASIVYADDGQVMGSFKTLIAPDGWGITDGATAVNGITTARAARFGMPILQALQVLARMCDVSSALVAHNIQFDLNLVLRELEASKRQSNAFTRGRLMHACTMKLGAPLNGGRWPKLTDLIRILFGEEWIQTHDGLDDATQAARCFLELRRRGMTGEEL